MLKGHKDYTKKQRRELRQKFNEKILNNLEKVEKNDKTKYLKKPNTLDIKVGWNELLYDLIFIIIIGKIIEMVVSVPIDQMTFTFILSQLILFIVMVWMWMQKVLTENQLHIYKKYKKIDMPFLKRITYIEITVIIILLSKINHNVTISFYRNLAIILIIIAFLTNLTIRRYLINNTQETPEEIKSNFATYHIITHTQINYKHLIERIGILIILFLGELFSIVFEFTDNGAILFLTLGLLMLAFNDYMAIIDRLEEKANCLEYTLSQIKFFAYTIFVFLISLIILAQYMEINEVNLLIPIIILLCLNKVYTVYYITKLNNNKITLDKIFEIFYYSLVITLVFMTNINNILIIILVISLIILKSKIYKEEYEPEVQM